MTGTLDECLVRMRVEGKHFGYLERLKQKKPQMPEPVEEGSGVGIPEYRISGTEVFRTVVMKRFGLNVPYGYYWTWPQFFDRTQDEINRGFLIADGSFIIHLGPGAQSTMLPASARLVSGVPDSVKLRIVGKIFRGPQHLSIETETEQARIEQRYVRAVYVEELRKLYP